MLRVVTELRDGRNFVKEWELVPGNFTPSLQNEYAVAHVGMDQDFPSNFHIFYIENNTLYKAAIDTNDRIVPAADWDDTVPYALDRANAVGVFANL
jgi:hypothetical protein